MPYEKVYKKGDTVTLAVPVNDERVCRCGRGGIHHAYQVNVPQAKWGSPARLIWVCEFRINTPLVDQE